MPGLPTGTVTFLFTDIEGSTRLLQQLGDRYAEVLAAHHRLLRSAIQGAQGQVVDTQVSRRVPLLLILEDIHSAEDATLDFVEHTATPMQAYLLGARTLTSSRRSGHVHREPSAQHRGL